MNTQQVILSPLDELAERINAEHDQCVSHMRDGLAHAAKAGELLIDAKALCPHGEWIDWLQAHCDFSERTAQGYMRIAREWPALADSKAQRVADLSFRGALKMLAEPREAVSEMSAEAKTQERLIRCIELLVKPGIGQADMEYTNATIARFLMDVQDRKIVGAELETCLDLLDILGMGFTRPFSRSGIMQLARTAMAEAA